MSEEEQFFGGIKLIASDDIAPYDLVVGYPNGKGWFIPGWVGAKFTGTPDQKSTADYEQRLPRQTDGHS